ncbi:hypothetical protein E4U42_000883 [Claviceps africana]|uniref:Chitin-binding type-2 domain-containing protein n=1 Tax=Claviceps africana TaxID=83212 RepID=A0A8K0IZX2_9HYPO|nr:hypothetical protein E4U42_000883 [Claviceps africana]
MQLSASAVLASIAILAGQTLAKCTLLDKEPPNMVAQLCTPDPWIKNYFKCDDAYMYHNADHFIVYPNGHETFVRVTCQVAEPDGTFWKLVASCVDRDGSVGMVCPGQLAPVTMEALVPSNIKPPQ